MDKKTLRQQIRKRKSEHTAQQLAQLSLSAISRLHDIIQTELREKATYRLEPSRHEQTWLNDTLHTEENRPTILLYHSLPDEVNTLSLIRQLHAEGHTVLLPTVVGTDLELHVYTGDTDLTTSADFGIAESTGPLFTNYTNIDLAVIPGMAFTPDGRRLGRGKGFYDRLLPQLSCKKIGLAFPFQIVDDIPCESHDIMMDMVVI